MQGARLGLLSSPAMRPDLNGCVERAQATWRYEIYAIYDLPDRIEKLQAFVDAFAHKFNRHTPRLPDAPQRISKLSAAGSRHPRLRRICAEPGQPLERTPRIS
jgi:hypothetical protein